MRSSALASVPRCFTAASEEITKDEQAWANDYIFKKTQGDGKDVYYIRTPIVFTEDPMVKEESGRGRAPRLGEDSSEILKSIGYDDATVADFLANGVIVENK